jgi:FMN-dependent NADH-azoreductase
VPCLKDILNLVGIEDFQVIVLQGVDAFPERASELNAQAMEQAIATATTFCHIKDKYE